MAEGVLRHLSEDTEDLEIASAGTGAWHVGEPPDTRAQRAAAARGIDISGQRAQKIKPQHFAEFDLILAMDKSNYRDLLAISPPEHEHKVRMFLDYAPEIPASEVPDPYFGGNEGFNTVLDMIELASEGLLENLHGQ
jgi:protein-tyrosine phosphatase